MKQAETMESSCLFCKIVRKEIESQIVFEDDISMGFLDHRPLFPGHSLMVPKRHYRTVLDFPEPLTKSFSVNVQKLALAVEEAMHAEGSFIAANNRISQSVPHAHVHIVPRRKGDGLKGFFWPRGKYKDAAEMLSVQAAIRNAVALLPAVRAPE